MSVKTSNLFFPQIKASTPVLMCSVPGYDASSRVDDLAAEMSKQITSIAIGKKKMLNFTKNVAKSFMYTRGIPPPSVVWDRLWHSFHLAIF